MPVTNPTWSDFVRSLEREFICPRCSGDVPNTLHRGEYVGALSRTDNETIVCSECGQQEAFEQFFSESHSPMPQYDWDAAIEHSSAILNNRPASIRGVN